MREIVLLVTLLFISAVIAADRTCQPTTGIRNSLCGNSTANTYAIPAKVCAYGPVDVSITACASQVFNTWQLLCPKRNLDLTSFCQGWGGFENVDYTYPCMVLQSCTSDTDCKRTIAPLSPPEQKKCYSCCQLCYNDCAARVTSGEYAAQGDTNCIACPYTATPHTLPPIPATPTAAPVAAPKAPPVAAPLATPVTTPKAPPVATPVTAPVTAPKAPPVAVPVAAPKATPVATPVVAPVTAPKAPPVAVPIATPVAAPKATPVAVPVSSPIAAPVAAPVTAPKAPPVAVPIATPVAAPKATPVAAPIAAPVTVPKAPPVATPVASPVAVPVTAPKAPPVASPVTTPIAFPIAPKGTPVTTTTGSPDASTSSAKIVSVAARSVRCVEAVLAVAIITAQLVVLLAW